MRILSHREAAQARRTFAYRIRIFDPRGHYPEPAFVGPDTFYCATSELVYTVVWSKEYDQLTDELPYSEMDWVTPEELRFWSSILLCEDTYGPKVRLYPHLNAYVLASDRIDLTDQGVQSEIRDILLEEAATSSQPRWGGDIRTCLNAEYRLFKNEYHHRRQPAFYAAISVNDHCFLRAISCLIKSDMLSQHCEFVEEAGLVAFIALDASYSLVSDLLRRKGNKNPSALDAGRWLDETFNQPVGIDSEGCSYFEEFHTQRIMSIHPSSRFGAALYAPFIHDDYIRLREDLREIFAYLVLSEHGPEFQRRLDEQKRSPAKQSLQTDEPEGGGEADSTKR